MLRDEDGLGAKRSSRLLQKIPLVVPEIAESKGRGANLMFVSNLLRNFLGTSYF